MLIKSIVWQCADHVKKALKPKFYDLVDKWNGSVEADCDGWYDCEGQCSTIPKIVCRDVSKELLIFLIENNVNVSDVCLDSSTTPDIIKLLNECEIQYTVKFRDVPDSFLTNYLFKIKSHFRMNHIDFF